MLDLDNTLIDRDAAFRSWAAAYVQAHQGSPEDLSWLLAADQDGYESRERMADLIGQRFADTDTGSVLDDLLLGMVDRIVLDPAVTESLLRARTAGWSLVVVTNGSVAQQERKLLHTGLDRCVDGWVISEGVGIRKPDPAIFTHALAMTGDEPASAWMIGDSATHDVRGAQAVGVHSVWLGRGRPWPDGLEPPDHVADTLTDAVDRALAASG